MNQSTTQATETCLTEGCPNLPFRRGTCQSCYESFRRLIRNKETTWPRLEKLGMVRPSASRRDGVCKSRAVIAVRKAAKRVRKSAKLAKVT